MLFVDDAILFGEGSLEEWTSYKSIIDLFYKSTSMKTSESKSIFLESNLDDNTIREVKKYFPYEFKPLHLGFKYLGHFLKPNSYGKEDWIWLVRNFENKISHWCNRWVTLGGRIILVKAVLENITVDWFSLAKIPCSILDIIGKKKFHFLWVSNKQGHAYHLSKWQDIARPKDYGSWGIKHIYHFGRDLVAKSLWSGLFGFGMWQEIIKWICLRFRLLDSWLREDQRGKQNISNIWCNCLSSKDIVTKWISWSPGDGSNIRLGEDPILGMGDYYNLFEGILLQLHERGFSICPKARLIMKTLSRLGGG